MRRNYKRAIIFLFLLLLAAQIPLISVQVQGDLSDLSKESGTTQPLYDVSWKPDGSYALIIGGGGTVLKYVDNTFENLKSSSSTDSLESLAWKPDGSYALIVGWNGTYIGKIIKYDGNAFTTLTEGVYPAFYGVGWNSDGSYALIVGGNGTVLKYDGKSLTKLSTGGVTGGLRGISWKPNGDYALIVGDSGLVLRYEGGIFTSIQNITSKNLRYVAWRSDGGLAIVTGDPPGTLLSYDGFALKAVSTGVTGWLHGISWRTGANEALIVGFSGTVLEYLEGRVSVIMDRSTPFNVTPHLRGVSWRPNTPTALIAGAGGTIIEYKSTNKIGELVAVVDEISPNPANETDIITFKGHGAGGTGQIDGYNWSFSFSSDQIQSAEFKRKIPAGNHTVYFSVKDSDETWSLPTSKKLTISSPVSSSPDGQQNPSPSPSDNQQSDSTVSGSRTDVFTVITSYMIWIVVILVAAVLLIPLLEYRTSLYERRIETEIISFLRNNPNSRLYKIYAHFREKHGMKATRRMNLKKIINNSVRAGKIERTSEENPRYKSKQ